MNESGTNELIRLYPKLVLIEQLSKKWSISTARELMGQMQSAEKLLKTKKMLVVKKSLKHCVATLSGVIAGRENKLIEKTTVKKYLKKLFPVVTTIQDKILEMDILPKESPVPTPKQKPLTIRLGGKEEISAEASKRLQQAIVPTEEFFQDPTLSTMEQNWEESEFNRVLKEHKLEEWNQEFFGEINEDFIRYAEQVEQLKRVLKKQAILQIAPVVPAAKHEQIFKVPALKQNGIKVKYTAGYPVFEDQLILLVNKNEVANSSTETDAYKHEVKKYKKLMEKAATKFSKISLLEATAKQLVEEIKWLNEQPIATDTKSKVGSKNPIAEARTERLNRLTTSLEDTKAQVEKQKLLHVEEYAAYAELMDQYKEFTKANKPQLKGKMIDSSVQIFSLAEKCLEEINSRLTPVERLVFVTPHGIPNGYVTCFWVMPDIKFGAWSGDLCFSKLKLQIKDWCFPQQSLPNKVKSVALEVETQQDLIKYVHSYVLIDETKEYTFHMAQKWLELRRIKYSEYYELLLEKVWIEAPEVLGLKIRRAYKEVVIPKEITQGIFFKNR